MKHTELILLLILVTVLAAALISCGHTHVFEGWRTTTEPTCTATGVRTGTCACGQTATEPIPATGHGKTAQRIAAEPDCTNDGSLVTYCTVCSGTVEETAIPARGHEGVSEIVREPTCKQAGREQTVCTVCEATYNARMLPMVKHSELPYTYNGDATALADGTATAQCPHCEYTDTVPLVGSSARIRAAFEGKRVSILGDSISTYVDITSGVAADTTNSTIRDNIVWGGYRPSSPAFGGTGVGSTWWQRTIDAMGATRLVNNSHAGESISGAARGRCMQLHDDTGDNAGECPDIIFVYLGTNDCNRTMGDIRSLTDSEIAHRAELSNYVPSTVAEGYAILLYRMMKTYPDAEIYCLTNLERSDIDAAKTAAVCETIRQVVARFEGVHLVDIAEECGIRSDAADFEFYIPKDGGNKSIHPGVEGMRAIHEVLMKVVVENSKYMTEPIEGLLP